MNIPQLSVTAVTSTTAFNTETIKTVHYSIIYGVNSPIKPEISVLWCNN